MITLHKINVSYTSPLEVIRSSVGKKIQGNRIGSARGYVWERVDCGFNDRGQEHPHHEGDTSKDLKEVRM